MRPRASCGLLQPCVADLGIALQVANGSGFDFLLTSLVHPRYQLPEITAENASEVASPADKIEPRNYPFTRSDLLLPSSDWSSLFVAILSRDCGLESPQPHVRRQGEERLKRELAFASHLGRFTVSII